MWQTHYEAARGDYPHIEGRRLIHETIRRIINTLIVDLIEYDERESGAHESAIRSMTCATRRRSSRTAKPVAAQATELKRFLFKNLYRHYRVMRMANKARRVVSGLFNAFTDDPRLLPPAYQARGPIGEESANDPRGSEAASGGTQARLIAHYIAGMTDRYALKEYGRLFVIDDN